MQNDLNYWYNKTDHENFKFQAFFPLTIGPVYLPESLWVSALPKVTSAYSIFLLTSTFQCEIALQFACHLLLFYHWCVS